MREDLLRRTKIIGLLDIFTIFIGILFKSPYMYIGMNIGLIVSAISSYILYLSVKKSIENKDIFLFIRYTFFRYVIYFLALYIVYKLLLNLNKKVEIGVFLCAISFLSYQVIMYLEKLFGKEAN